MDDDAPLPLSSLLLLLLSGSLRFFWFCCWDKDSPFKTTSSWLISGSWRQGIRRNVTRLRTAKRQIWLKKEVVRKKFSFNFFILSARHMTRLHSNYRPTQFAIRTKFSLLHWLIIPSLSLSPPHSSYFLKSRPLSSEQLQDQYHKSHYWQFLKLPQNFGAQNLWCAS